MPEQQVPAAYYYDIAAMYPVIFDGAGCDLASWACERSATGPSCAGLLVKSEADAPLPDHLCLPTFCLSILWYFATQGPRPLYGSAEELDQYGILTRTWPRPATDDTITRRLQHFGHQRALVPPLLPGQGANVGLIVHREGRIGSATLLGPILRKAEHLWYFGPPIIETFRVVQDFEAGRDAQLAGLVDLQHQLIQWYKRVAQGRTIRGPGQTDNRAFKSKQDMLDQIATMVRGTNRKQRATTKRWVAGKLGMTERNLRRYINKVFPTDWEAEVVPRILS